MKDERKYTAAEIEALLSIPCCHTSGMHDPVHFQERKYVCEHQQSDALKNLCRVLGINPTTKSKPDCYWCQNYPEKKKAGEGLPLLEGKD